MVRISLYFIISNTCNSHSYMTAISNNLLYPKENKRERKLYFACRNCDHQEEARTHCTYRSSQQASSSGLNMTENRSSLVDMASDPTLPKTTRICPKCGHRQAVYFQSRERNRETAMTLSYLCCNSACNHLWTDTSGVSIPGSSGVPKASVAR